MAAANPLWGAPRIHGELLKLGIEVAERTVSRLMPKRRPQPSQTWRTFLANHVRDLVSIDFFTVPTARLRVLFVLVVLAHHRRRVVHFNVTEHPTAAWTAQQIVDAFPDDSAPAYLLRDRDHVYGHAFRHRVKGMGIGEVLTAPHSPWQNPFAERLIGSIRRECLDHVLVLSERHLRRILTRYFAYYHRARTHLALEKDAPDGRPIERPEVGTVVPIPKSAVYIIATSAGQHNPASTGPRPATNVLPRRLFVVSAVIRPARTITSSVPGPIAEACRLPCGGPSARLSSGVLSPPVAHGSSPGESDAVLAKDRRLLSEGIAPVKPRP